MQQLNPDERPPLDHCSFCLKNKSQVAKLVGGIAHAICIECIKKFKGDLADPKRYKECEPYEKCSFACVFIKDMDIPPVARRQGKDKILGGPFVWSCQSCLEVSYNVLPERLK